jgi:hypothetical protein
MTVRAARWVWRTGKNGRVTRDRTLAATAVIEGFFGFAWFGWGQADAPTVLSVVYAVLSAAALVVAVLGVVAVRRSSGPSPMADPAVRRRYNVIVGIEFGVILVGAIALGRAGEPGWIPVWVAAVVGVHFVPLAAVFPGTHLVALGVVVTAVALAALVIGLATDVAPGTVTGGGAGVALLVGGAAALVDRRTEGPSRKM